MEKAVVLQMREDSCATCFYARAMPNGGLVCRALPPLSRFPHLKAYRCRDTQPQSVLTTGAGVGKSNWCIDGYLRVVEGCPASHRSTQACRDRHADEQPRRLPARTLA